VCVDHGLSIDSDAQECLMRTHANSGSTPTIGVQVTGDRYGELPNRLMTVFEVAQFVGCHEETVRRAYLRGLLVSQRFGVRSRRFNPRDVLDWIARGAPTRVS
jgi:excisionase family DNA binding protein